MIISIGVILSWSDKSDRLACLGHIYTLNFEGEVEGAYWFGSVQPSPVCVGPQGPICPHPGAIYMYITIIFKHHLL